MENSPIAFASLRALNLPRALSSVNHARIILDISMQITSGYFEAERWRNSVYSTFETSSNVTHLSIKMPYFRSLLM